MRASSVRAIPPPCPNDFRSRVCISVSHPPFSLLSLLLLLHQYGFRPDLGNAGQAMCAYSGVNGVPCCAHDYLQNKVGDLHFYARGSRPYDDSVKARGQLSFDHTAVRRGA